MRNGNHTFKRRRLRQLCRRARGEVYGKYAISDNKMGISKTLASPAGAITLLPISVAFAKDLRRGSVFRVANRQGGQRSINDVKWGSGATPCQRLATRAIAVRPLITPSARRPRYGRYCENTLKWGPYYLIAPGIALHARPEQGANNNQISVARYQRQ